MMVRVVCSHVFVIKYKQQTKMYKKKVSSCSEEKKNIYIRKNIFFDINFVMKSA